MEVSMKKLILATASVLALGVGATAVGHADDIGNTPTSAGRNMPASPEYSQHVQRPGSLSKDEIRQAQLELRNIGFYEGSLDGVVGPETRQGIGQFQKRNGLNQTTTLDQQTMDKLIGNAAIGQGSSVPLTPPHGTALGSSNSGGLR
jgi:peptidoglycan hydrolase-like protein with peptidoglycan-binding domain